MKKKTIIRVLVVMMLIVGVYFNVSNATSKPKTYTEEEMQTLISEKVDSAVLKAVTDMKSEEAVENVEPEEEVKEDKSAGIAYIAAAIATGIACIGAGIAVAVVASSAVGAVSENPSLLGKTIIFAGLAEGIAIYGLIIAIMILNKV